MLAPPTPTLNPRPSRPPPRPRQERNEARLRRWAKLRRGVLKHFLVAQFNFGLRKKELDAARRERWRKCRERSAEQRSAAQRRHAERVGGREMSEGAQTHRLTRARSLFLSPSLAPQAPSS